MRTSVQRHSEKERVLTKSVLNLAHFYHFSGKDLSDMIGISEASVSRLHQGKKFLSPHTKEGEMALLLIRIYRSLNALLGNHHDKARVWLNSHNHYFQNKPILLMKSIPGLVSVLNYLDAMRGKL
ncbi:MAG TPA: antitoxin Xre/MbcA/ParS toxin-binding domain-containing protein [Legionellaceae bacterium]|nr:antitoxin Xre/MbcA/ParS toxin-binding domain-containing protein [Legionellaceae bacterium]